MRFIDPDGMSNSDAVAQVAQDMGMNSADVAAMQTYGDLHIDEILDDGKGPGKGGNTGSATNSSKNGGPASVVVSRPTWKNAPKIAKLTHWWERLFSVFRGGRDYNGINYDADGNPQGYSLNKLEFTGAVGPPEDLGALSELSVEKKLLSYLLNFDHPVGVDKAIWFDKALGFTTENYKELAGQLVFDEAKAIQTEVTPYGVKFNQIIPVTGANGKIINVLTAWIRNNDNVVRLVTAYPAK